ncbi:hypothetical protein FW778_02265 [Ginsengibacter hankyongi]|uniref:Uncharacterized protein n=1 Tax=Ginsengibacter hankyongi TaxID=2607284 RepID=A0A5J5IIL4_9BACT|nr:hypothetical protein [Ginsengibacter hankyongi]KAA9040885.1 hypothetical protein FW778_02265 [Ginsengibacter hankyongi]
MQVLRYQFCLRYRQPLYNALNSFISTLQLTHPYASNKEIINKPTDSHADYGNGVHALSDFA